jgi:endogenous inhibitor of DNA gyrase (YacG/DUF329 family)
VSVATCPICGKPTDAKFRPFCSARCADVDLHRWLTGGYSIAGEDEEEGEGRVSPNDPDETV